MKVNTGAVVGGRSLDVEMTENDGVAHFGYKWEEWNIPTKFKRLTALADLMLVQYLLAEELIPQSMANSRFANIKKSLADE
jgi:hypothetical protein